MPQSCHDCGHTHVLDVLAPHVRHLAAALGHLSLARAVAAQVRHILEDDVARGGVYVAEDALVRICTLLSTLPCAA